MSNSSLVSYTQISPNRNSPRNHAIDRITIHCVVGQCTLQGLGAVFADPNRQASSNYGISWDGKVGMYCPESDRSWCSSSAENDNRAVTIETASDNYYPYAVYDTAFNTLIDLCEDICRRNGKTKLIWFGDKNTTLNYQPKADEMIMTAHKWFADTFCPGDYLYNRFGTIAKTVTERLDPMNWIKKWQLEENGKLLSGWQKVDGEWYVLEEVKTPLMVTGWYWDKSYKGWFYLDGSGKMLTGWIKDKGLWYYLYPETTNSTVKGMMATGWLSYKGKWYYLDPNKGYMYTGTHVIDGKTYTFDSSGALVS